MPSFSICERRRTPVGAKPAKINDVGIEFFDLGEFGIEILLIGTDTERSKDSSAFRDQKFREKPVVAFAIIGSVVNNDPGLVPLVQHEIGGDVILVDHRTVDAMHLFVIVAVSDFR